MFAGVDWKKDCWGLWAGTAPLPRTNSLHQLNLIDFVCVACFLSFQLLQRQGRDKQRHKWIERETSQPTKTKELIKEEKSLLYCWLIKGWFACWDGCGQPLTHSFKNNPTKSTQEKEFEERTAWKDMMRWFSNTSLATLD